MPQKAALPMARHHSKKAPLFAGLFAAAGSLVTLHSARTAAHLCAHRSPLSSCNAFCEGRPYRDTTSTTPPLRRQRPRLARQRIPSSTTTERLPSFSTTACADGDAPPMTYRRTGLRWVMERLRNSIGGIEQVWTEDISDGHVLIGFSDGSGRATNPKGIDLKLTVVSSTFIGLSLLERHMAVSSALQPEVLSGAIHSLPHLRTLTPEQWQTSKPILRSSIDGTLQPPMADALPSQSAGKGACTRWNWEQPLRVEACWDDDDEDSGVEFNL